MVNPRDIAGERRRRRRMYANWSIVLVDALISGSKISFFSGQSAEMVAVVTMITCPADVSTADHWKVKSKLYRSICL